MPDAATQFFGREKSWPLTPTGVIHDEWPVVAFGARPVRNAQTGLSVTGELVHRLLDEPGKDVIVGCAGKDVLSNREREPAIVRCRDSSLRRTQFQAKT